MDGWQARFAFDALLYVALVSLYLLGLVLYDPRLMLQDYPPAIQAVVPPKTAAERRTSLILGLPFLVLLLAFPVYATFTFRAAAVSDAGFFTVWAYAFGIVFAFNVWDWLIIDWVVFCAITPRWAVIPGSEGHPGYKDYAFHFRGFVIGTA